MLPALIVGALTAWYMGIRIGVITAIATAGALLVATFVPGMTMAIYALVIAWCAALYFFGAKIGKVTGKSTMSSLIGNPISQATSWVKKALGKK